MMRLVDKVAIVTGGGGGIGAAVARRLVAEGAFVVIADLFEEAAIRAAEPLGDKALAVQFDAVPQVPLLSTFQNDCGRAPTSMVRVTKPAEAPKV